MSNQEIILPDPAKLLASSSPHIHDQGKSKDFQRIMLCVILALMPACGAGIYYFGLPALYTLLVSVGGCVAAEYLWNRANKQKTTITDLSCVVSGLLLGMNLSAHVPWWIALIGAVVTICVGKMLYGGIGYNPFNPAIVGRIFLLLSFPAQMTTWYWPRTYTHEMIQSMVPTPENMLLAASQLPETIVSATPLGIVHKANALVLSDAVISTEALKNYFLGNMPGCLGETCAIAILIGGIFLIAMRIIRWQVPVAYLGTIAFFIFIINLTMPSATPGPIFHLLSGGVMLAAFFMITDMVTTPITTSGAILFAVGAAVITVVIRVWGGFPEGVSFSILLMNALTPLIDRYTRQRPFGWRKPLSKGGAQ